MRPNLTRDADLVAETEILERINSIHRQREALCVPPVRTEHHLAFERRQAKIAKLTEREDSMRVRLRAARRTA